MSGWQKVNVAGSDDDNTFVCFMSDLETKLADKIGWTAPGDRNGRWATIIDHGKITYAEVETELQAVTVSGGEFCIPSSLFPGGSPPCVDYVCADVFGG